MSQKLSAMNYIKNNKRRISVLIVSLSLFYILVYVSNFILSTTSETFKTVLIEQTKKMQFISPSPEFFGINYDNNKVYTDEEEQLFLDEYEKKQEELIKKLEDVKGVEYVKEVQYIEYMLKSVVGRYYCAAPCVESKDVNKVMSHMGATLKDGKIPEKAGELILDESTMKNNNYSIGDSIFTNDYKIVGVANCDTYFACGVSGVNSYDLTNDSILILSDGSIKDFTKLLTEMGYNITSTDNIVDYENGVKKYDKDVVDAINGSTSVIYIGIILVLSICIIAVYSLYLRDRHSEWCLYSSIGFSSKQIYFSIMRELLFTFLLAMIIGTVICVISIIVLDKTLISTLGLKCKYLSVTTIVQIIAANIIIYGLLQIPIRYALFKIKTVDAIDDDLN